MKKAIALLLLLVFSLGLCAAAEMTSSVEGIQADREWYDMADCSVLSGKKIGISIQSLKNAYWIGTMGALGEALEGYGADATIVSCSDNAAIQMEQLEAFIANGCDLIMVHPSDASVVEEVCAKAREKGIKVMCWDDPMENTDVNWILNNTDLGLEIGRMAGAFIDEHFTDQDKAGVIVIGYPQTKVLLEREQGIMAGLDEIAGGKYEVVANLSALIPSEALDTVETAMGVHPDAKVVVGIGAGPMLGADEAISTIYNGEIPEDVGVFTADVTRQQLEHIAEDIYPARGIIGYEGSDMDTAQCCAALFARLLTDEVESHNIYRPIVPITDEIAKDIMDGMK